MKSDALMPSSLAKSGHQRQEPTALPRSGASLWHAIWFGCPAILYLALFYLAYVLAGGLGQGLTIIPGIAVSFWPPAGIFVAMLLLSPKATWPWWVIAGCLAEMTCNALWFHNPVLPALGYFSANALEALTAAWLIKRFVAKPFRLESFEEVAAFVVLGACAAPIVGATVGSTVAVLANKLPFATTWPLWWLGDGTGLLVSAPLSLVAVQAWREKANIPMSRSIEAVAIGLVLLGIEAWALSGHLPSVYAALPALLWAAVRFQFKGAAAALALMTLLAAVFTATKTGEFAGDPVLLYQKIVVLQAFLGISAISALLVAALALKLQQTLRQLETQVDERTTDLHESESKLALFVEHAPAAIAMFDTGMRYLACSRRFLADYRLRQDVQVIGRSHYDLFPEIQQRWRDIHQRVLTGEELSHEEDAFPRPDGSIDWVRWTMKPWRTGEGRIGGALLFSEVITAQVEAKRRLETRDAMLAQVNDMVIAVDLDERITYFNAAAERQYGKLANEVRGRKLNEIYTYRWPTAEAEAAALAALREHGYWRGENVHRAMDGRELYVESNVIALRDHMGAPSGFLASIRDIGERKRAEERLQANERRQAYLLKLADALRPLSDPIAIQTTAMTVLGSHLKASRAGYAEDSGDGETIVLTRSYTDGVPDITGRHRYGDYGDTLLAQFRAGVTVIRSDVVNDPSLTAAEKQAHSDLMVGAAVNKPLVKGGRLLAMLFVHHPTAHAWTPEELTLIEETAERTWAAVEKSRAETALRESEERNRFLVENTSDMVFHAGLREPLPLDLPLDQQVDWIFDNAYLAAVNDGFACAYSYDKAEGLTGRPMTDVLPRTPANQAMIRAVAKNGHRVVEARTEEVDRQGNRKVMLNSIIGKIENGHVTGYFGSARGITERVLAEEALATSLERMEAAEYATGALIYDAVGGRVWRSGGLMRLLGWSPDEVPATIEGWRSLWHPDDVARFRNLDAEALLDAAGRYTYEYRARHKDGHYVWLMDRGLVLRDASGATTRIVGASFDITGRKQAEDALRESEQRFRAIFNHQFQFSALLTPDGKIVDMSESAMINTGLSREEVIGREFVSLRFFARAPETRELWRNQFAELQSQDRSRRVEAPYHLEDGLLRYAINTVTALRNEKGEIKFLLAEGIDITERKQAEEQLRYQLQLVRNITDTAAVSIFVNDKDGNISFINPEAERVFGYSLNELKGKSLHEVLHYKHPDGRPFPIKECPLGFVYEDGRPVRDYEGVFWRKDGAPVNVLCSNMPIQEHRQSVGDVITVQDITERKRHEEHQKLMMHELNHRVKNTLATIQSMAMQTLRNSPDLTEARVRFEARLVALSKAHDVLTREKWEGAPLTDIVERAITPYRGEGRDRFDIKGPAMRVSPRQALALAMALHELCTNAVKYGALSNDKGKVTIAWSVTGRGKGKSRLKLRWSEKGGPRVAPPTRKGFGSRLIERGLANDLGGEVQIRFARTGVTCEIIAPLDYDRQTGA